MGIESFYLYLLADDKTKREILAIIEKNQAFKEGLDYSAFESEGMISGALVSFFPVNEMVYSICKEMESRHGGKIVLASLKESHDFDFDAFMDYFQWIYKIWAGKLRAFNRDYGAFVVNPARYYETRHKLVKYYKKMDGSI